MKFDFNLVSYFCFCFFLRNLFLSTQLQFTVIITVPVSSFIGHVLAEFSCFVVEMILLVWLTILFDEQLAQKELQKINLYKAPRDKLVCILNCCKVINNLLVNASLASGQNSPGADEFLPVLIYVTIKVISFSKLFASMNFKEIQVTLKSLHVSVTSKSLHVVSRNLRGLFKIFRLWVITVTSM